MKYLKYLFIILFIPFIVLAEECDISKITIISIEQKGINGSAEELDDPEANDREIKLNLKMYEVGDSISYDMTINNASEEDYMIDEDTFKTDSEYIEYTLKTNDNSNVVKAQSTKDVTLTVTYKKEIEDDLLNNNKFDASNSLKLSLNTNEKEKELDIITTDNIKESLDPEEVKNPVTSVTSVMLISIILLTTIIISYVLIKRKNRYTKYLLLVLSMLLIPTVYAICKCDIEVESSIEIEKKSKLADTIGELSEEGNACVTKYEGNVTDEVGKTVQATNVYFDKCVDQRNVIFGGFCWQVIRTTETGGIKMIYNGEPVDGKCESTRENHTGIVQINEGTYENISQEYLYGTSFTYDTTNNTFTLINTHLSTWSIETYKNLLGKYTCKNTTGTCTTIYNINGYESNNEAYVSAYIIDDTNYAQIGNSSFNANSISPAMVGYMFNKVYNTASLHKTSMNYRTYKFGSTFSYRNGVYSLSGTTQNISNWFNDFNKLDNTHYTCWNETGECNTISYVYQTTQGFGAYYIDITGGKNVTDILNEMLYSEDVNKYNSSEKGIIEAWYAKNISSYTNYIEDTVYCNNRNIIDYGGWNPNGGNVTGYPLSMLKFKNYISTTDLACQNETDQFSVSNEKAKLTYPVALIQEEERYNINTASIMLTGVIWQQLSPRYFNSGNADVFTVHSDGNYNSNFTKFIYGVRPVVSLKSNNVISSGTGSESDPWIIE